MTDLRTAAKQALEALEWYRQEYRDIDGGTRFDWTDEAAAALRAALAEPPPHQYPLQSDRMRIDPVTGDVSIGTPQRPTEPVQEPVAWRWGYRSVTTGEMDWRGYVEEPAHPNLRSPAIVMEPLYTAPQRKPLSEEAIYRLFVRSGLGAYHQKDFVVQTEYDRCVEAFARAVERAHGIGSQP